MASGTISTGFRARYTSVSTTVASIAANSSVVGSIAYSPTDNWGPMVTLPRYTSSGLIVVSTWLSGTHPNYSVNFTVYNQTSSAKSNETVTCLVFETCN